MLVWFKVWSKWTRLGPQRPNSEQKQESVTHVMMRMSSRKYAGPHRVAGPHMPPPHTSKRPAARANHTSIKYTHSYPIRAPQRVESADTDTDRPSMARTTTSPTSQSHEESTDSVHFRDLTSAEAPVTVA